MKLLAAAPALLDLFVWLSYRGFEAKGPESIPLFGAYGLTRQLGCIEYSRPSRFRGMLEHGFAQSGICVLNVRPPLEQILT